MWSAGRQEHKVPQRRWNVAWLPVGIVLGATAGTGATWTLLSSDLSAFEAWLNAAQDLLLSAILGFCIAVVLGVPIGYWLLAKFVGGVEGTLAEITNETAAAAHAASQNDTPMAVEHTGRAIKEAIAWYAPRAARRFVIQTTLGLLLAFGGLIGTGLLFRQTLLLSAQNEKIDSQIDLLIDQNHKIDLQTVTAEAQRRGGLTSELFSIMQEVTKLPKQEPLSQPLIARIVAFSRAAQPYFTVVVPWDEGPPRRAKMALSPERGQLLAGMVLSGVDLKGLLESGPNFQLADLSEANLSSAKLATVRLSIANLTYADLSNADLSVANLSAANLSSADLYLANLSAADLGNANLSYANLHRADLSAANLRIPAQTSRRFRSIPAGDSDGSQPLIPTHSSHP